MDSLLIGMLELVKRIRESGVKFKGDLEFVNNWEYFTDGIASPPKLPGVKAPK